MGIDGHDTIHAAGSQPAPAGSDDRPVAAERTRKRRKPAFRVAATGVVVAVVLLVMMVRPQVYSGVLMTFAIKPMQGISSSEENWFTFDYIDAEKIIMHDNTYVYIVRGTDDGWGVSEMLKPYLFGMRLQGSTITEVSVSQDGIYVLVEWSGPEVRSGEQAAAPVLYDSQTGQLQYNPPTNSLDTITFVRPQIRDTGDTPYAIPSTARSIYNSTDRIEAVIQDSFSGSGTNHSMSRYTLRITSIESMQTLDVAIF